MLLLEQNAGLADREAYDRAGRNLLYRSLVGIGMDEPVPADEAAMRAKVA